MRCIAPIFSTQKKNRRNGHSCREPHLREPPASCQTLTDVDWRMGVLLLIANNVTNLSSCGRKCASMAPRTLLIGPSSSESGFSRWEQLKGTFSFLQNIGVFLHETRPLWNFAGQPRRRQCSAAFSAGLRLVPSLPTIAVRTTENVERRREWRPRLIFVSLSFVCSEGFH